VVGSPRVAVSGTNLRQHVLAIWVRAPSALVASSLDPQGGTFQALQPVIAATNPDGGAQRVLEVDALNVGTNDFQIAWTTADEPSGFSVTSRRIQENLDNQTGPPASFSSRAQIAQPYLVTNLGAPAMSAEETGLVWREVDVSVNPPMVTLRGSQAPLVGAPAVNVAGPAAGEWGAGVLATLKGTLVVWSQREDGRMQARGLDGGMSLNLTPERARAYLPSSPPSLAHAGEWIGVGHGSDGGLYGQLACEP
jgi:hypothetical protein